MFTAQGPAYSKYRVRHDNSTGKRSGNAKSHHWSMEIMVEKQFQSFDFFTTLTVVSEDLTVTGS